MLVKTNKKACQLQHTPCKFVSVLLTVQQSVWDTVMRIKHISDFFYWQVIQCHNKNLSRINLEVEFSCKHLQLEAVLNRIIAN